MNPSITGQARKLGCPGIVWKPLRSTYLAGRSKYWLKVKDAARRQYGEAMR
jgi:ATP-dependent DNA ligase